ncbi:hypothetical protein [Dyella nitratireducens]|uniref:hypothetical protein n=1 Tax=Dyella nitratireducens TaxID=1849580 RepID=UPI00166E2BAD|nr:hypothetical protein [Dyella nitratireducens]
MKRFQYARNAWHRKRTALSVRRPDSVDNCPRTARINLVTSRKWRRYAGFEALAQLASALQYQARKLQSLMKWRTAMKLETLMLNSFFAACVAICVSTLAAMLA